MSPYRLLVVDDEVTIREGIATAVPWESHGVRVVGQAADGTEGLALFRTERPDIVITDIQMDHMSGLDFLSRLREDGPSVKVIIVSGYDNFEYAQRAVELRTFAYVLKPVLPEELLEVVGRCIREIEEERRIRAKVEAFDAVLAESRLELKGQLVRDLLEGRIERREELDRRGELLGVDLRGPEYLCVLFSLDCYERLVKTEPAKELYRKVLGVHAVVSGVLGDEYAAEVAAPERREVVALLSGELRAGPAGKLDSRLRRIQESIRGHLGVTVTVGVSRVYEDPLELRGAFLEAARCLEYRLVVGKDSVITASDAAGMASTAHLYPADAEARVLRCLREQDVGGLGPAVASFFGELERQQYAEGEVATAASALASAASRHFAERGLPLGDSAGGGLLEAHAAAKRSESLGALAEWVAGALRRALGELEANRARQVKSVVRKAQEYVLRNYTRPDLSLELVADQVNLSSSYLSKLYRKETGQSYLDYVVGLRVEEARRRLRGTNARVADVGAAVGYPNPQYFCTLFRRVTGRTPAQYREQGDG